MIALLAAASVLSAPDDIQRRRSQPAPIQPGQKAVDFTAKRLGKDEKFTLSGNYGKRPTVLIFGSYT